MTQIRFCLMEIEKKEERNLVAFNFNDLLRGYRISNWVVSYCVRRLPAAAETRCVTTRKRSVGLDHNQHPIQCDYLN